jgi:ribonucleoside-diphosphate reductase alpha chain
LVLSPVALKILKKRYLKKNQFGKLESPEDLFSRVASVAAQVEKHYHPELTPIELQKVAKSFYQIMLRLDFLPNSPTLMNAGKGLNQLAACFVLPIEDSISSIFTTVKNAALIHKSGGGTGFDFSKIRPKNSIVHTTEGLASGPVSFIKVFDAATTAIKQGGTRMGANMAVLRIDHPDIFEFIEAKKKHGELSNFNLSVGITNEFIKAVLTNQKFTLRFKNKNYKTLDAQEILYKIALNAWQNGEPGLLFLDTINEGNPLPTLGVLAATNPCGEQPLLPFESCNLGSINLENMVQQGEINWYRLKKSIYTAVRFLDNIIDAGQYPLPEVEIMAKQNRKIGLGVMGWANMLYKLLIPYDSQEALNLAEQIMSYTQKTAHAASKYLAREKGSFPNITLSIYHERPMRNATCTTIAPTGSLSLIANTSPGIEPVFALTYRKKALEKNFKTSNSVFNQMIFERYNAYQCQAILKYVSESGSVQNCPYLDSTLKKVFVIAQEIKPEWHLKTQASFQKYCDNAVSKTINLPTNTTVEEISQIFLMAHSLKCKGITVYRLGSRQEEAQLAGI